MSPKAEKPSKRTAQEKVEGAGPAKARKERPARPRGSEPKAMVSSRRKLVMVERQGRGFSMGELEGADFPIVLARRWKLHVDLRRRSVLEWNVTSLKKWFAPPAKAPEPRPQPQAVQAKAVKEKAEKEKPKKRSPRKQPAKKAKRSPRT